ncbi:interferon gamma receptor 2-like [Rhinatrema bivittatum]|uniref:interferon gamma receptor 2-like n=1 Tax=Rhinatrema bivittatum TaxID=194408 RepID=UPI001125E8F5|nr:interferon gamma receptor 2-like [Rhinatrema bivittatum]
MSRFPAGPLLFLLLCGLPTRLLAESLSKLPAPQNVRIHSYNLKQVLLWDPVPVEDDTGRVTYWVEYIGHNDKDWNEINCSNITETKCDFEQHVYWRVTLRVRAMLGQLTSDWVNTTEFQADRDTIVGPPKSVKVSSDYGSLTVTFSPPDERISVISYQYYVYYWRENTAKKLETYSTSSTSVVLHDLDPWTVYCLQVLTEYKIWPESRAKYGIPSEIVCEKTTATGAANAIYAAKILFPTIFILFGLLVGCFIFKQKFLKDVKRWMSPPFRIPQHIEEYLNERMEHTLVPKLETCNFDEQYDTLSVVSSEETIPVRQ